MKLDVAFKSYGGFSDQQLVEVSETDSVFARKSSTEAPIRFSWKEKAVEENTFSTTLNPNLKREFKSDLPFKS